MRHMHNNSDKQNTTGHCKYHYLSHPYKPNKLGLGFCKYMWLKSPSSLRIKKSVIHVNLMLLTPLFKGSDVLTMVPRYQYRTFAGTQFWLDALPITTNDSYGYQWELNPGSLGTSP